MVGQTDGSAVRTIPFDFLPMEFLLGADNLNAEGVGVGGFEKQFEQALIGKKNCVQHKCIKKK